MIGGGGESAVEHLLAFALLCACVLYVAKVAFDFRSMGLRVTRSEDEEEGGSDEAGGDHDD
jgi:hypothetical protein